MVRNFTESRRQQHRYIQTLTSGMARGRDGSVMMARHLANWMWFVKYVVCDNDIRTLEALDSLLERESRPSRAPLATGSVSLTNFRIHRILVREFFTSTILQPLTFRLDLCHDGEIRVISNVGVEGYRQLQRQLVGYLFPVSELHYNRLLELGCHACYSCGGNRYFIMYGPLSFCNHHCRSPYSFSYLRQYTYPDNQRRSYPDPDIHFLRYHIPRNPGSADTRNRPVSVNARRRGLTWCHVGIRYMGEDDDIDPNCNVERGRELFIRYMEDTSFLPFDCRSSCCLPAGIH